MEWRRRVLTVGAGAIIASVCAATTVVTNPCPASASVAAYAWPTSVAQGDSVSIYVSTDAPSLDLTVYRRGDVLLQVARYDSLPGQNQTVPASVWSVGCGWRVTRRVPVNPAWPSGVYLAIATTHGYGSCYAIFTVRENDPGSTSHIVMVNCITTYEAYNAWGGKSLYDYNSTDGHRAYTVTFQRPYDLYGGRGDFPRWEERMVRFLEGNGYRIEYCTDVDVHHDASILSHYDLVLSVGHDEYWSYQMRRAYEERIAAGKNVAFFSGNICWWQIRCSLDRSKITCYKNRDLDPLTGIQDSLVTVNWYDDPVFRPENPVTGTSWRNGGYCDGLGYYPHSEGYGDYTVYQSGEWVYAETGLHDLDEFGWDDGIVGYECDGALFTMSQGLPVPTGTDGTPLNFTILGVSPASQGHATMGYYVAPSGAIVFNTATTDWADGLYGGDPYVIQITKNVLDHLAPAATSVAPGSPGGGASAVSAARLPLALSIAPNPTHDVARIRFAGTRSSRAGVTIAGADGRLVATLPAFGSEGDGSGTVIWNGRDMQGNRVRAGIYFAQLQDDASRATQKILLLR